MGILPYKVLCNAALCVFHISLLKVTLSKVVDPDIEMKGKSGAGVRGNALYDWPTMWCTALFWHHTLPTQLGPVLSVYKYRFGLRQL